MLIKVFGANGQQITSSRRNLAGGQHTQLNSFLFSRGITLDDGRVEVAVTSATGNNRRRLGARQTRPAMPSTVVPVTLESSGNTKWVIPGVADIHSGFANWQSDVRIFNANTAGDGRHRFVSTTGRRRAEGQTIRMNPGEVKQYDKVLAALFGNAGPTVGALHLSTAQPSRSSPRHERTTTQPTGTYGQFISAVTPGEAVAWLASCRSCRWRNRRGMRSNVAFRRGDRASR